MSKKVTYCFKFDYERDKDIIDVLNERFNRTAFIRHLVREYLKEEMSLEEYEEPYY